MKIKTLPASEFKKGNPGFYVDVPDGEYHAFDACSNSRLSKVNESPDACLRSIEEESDDTDAKRMGRASHARILQPEVYHKSYGIFEGDLRSGAQKDLWAKMAEEYGEGNVVRAKDAIDIEGMAKAVMDNAPCKAILSLGGMSEISALWVHEETGLLCKMRIDRLVPDLDLIVDYKTTRDIRTEWGLVFVLDESTKKYVWRSTSSWTVYKYGYHRQAAFYLMGMKALGCELKDFVTIPQEKVAPYPACAMRIKNNAIEAGRAELAPLFKKYAHCKNEKYWPKFGDTEIIDVDIPLRAYQDIYEEQLTGI